VVQVSTSQVLDAVAATCLTKRTLPQLPVELSAASLAALLTATTTTVTARVAGFSI
jgi:hypothetical protein